MTKVFKLGEYTIEFEESFANYNLLKNEFMELAESQSEKFVKLYKQECLTIEDVHFKALNLGYNCINEALDRAIAVLISNDLLVIDKDNFIDKYYSNYLTWEDEYEKVDRRYRSIVLTADQEKEYREEKKDCRGRWQGGGFGLRGAVSGAMQAGALNMASGVAYSVFNSLGNKLTESSTNEEKLKLFNDSSVINTLVEGLKNNIIAVNYAIVDALLDNCINTYKMYVTELNSNKANALINNLKTGLIPKEKQDGLIKEIAQLDPYNKGVYVYLYKINGDEDRGIEQIVQFLGINIDDEKKVVIDEYFNSLNNNTEEETIESMEKFKAFAACRNCEDVEVYINKFNEILKVHDINIRTVDGILFETREEAAEVRREYEGIIEVENKIAKETEEEIQKAIDEIKSRNYTSIINHKHLEDLKERLVKSIRLADQEFLNVNYNLNNINSEHDADLAIENLLGVELRNRDLLENRVNEIKVKRSEIIESIDSKVLNEYFNTLLMLSTSDIQKATDLISEFDIRTEKVKNEKIQYLISNSDKIIKKHNSFLEKAIKYEIRLNTEKKEVKEEKKGIFGFVSKAIEKGSSMIDEIQAKSEREAWNFITNNGTRAIDDVRKGL